ncbi:hypothetical protein LPICM02_310025 [Pseudolactococcus piscium]|nr:hypothetical protein LPICM02_310025 [Lactococcus piscium]
MAIMTRYWELTYDVIINSVAIFRFMRFIDKSLGSYIILCHH